LAEGSSDGLATPRRHKSGRLLHLSDCQVVAVGRRASSGRAPARAGAWSLTDLMPSEHPTRRIDNLGFYTLAGRRRSPRTSRRWWATAEELGLGLEFHLRAIQREGGGNTSGAVGAVSRIFRSRQQGTNHHTRHPIVTAFVCGDDDAPVTGRSVHPRARDRVESAPSRAPRFITTHHGEWLTSQEVMRGSARRVIFGHNGPAGTVPIHSTHHSLSTRKFFRSADCVRPEFLALGRDGLSITWLSTRFFDGRGQLARCVRTGEDGSEQAGTRYPAAVRVWSCFADLGRPSA